MRNAKREKRKINRKLQLQYASEFSIGSMIFGLIIAFSFIENKDNIPLFGQPSLTSLIALIAFVISVPVTMIAYRILHDDLVTLTEIEKQANQGRENWFARIAVSIVTGILTIASTVFVFFLLSQVADDIEVSSEVALLIVALYSGLVGFGIAFWASALTSDILLVLTGICMIFGLSLAIVNIEEPEWFDNSISYMSHAEGSNTIFQLTFILSGMVLLVVKRDILRDLQFLKNMGKFDSLRFNFFALAVTSLPIFIMGIGMFPTTVNDFSDFMHNFSSHVPVAIYLILMFGLNYLIPIYEERFLMISRALGIAGLLVIVGWSILNLYNFVVFEFLLIIIVGIWTTLFFDATKDYVRVQNLEESVEQR